MILTERAVPGGSLILLNRYERYLYDKGMHPTEQVKSLTRFALSLPGVQHHSSGDSNAIHPILVVPGPVWGEFFRVVYPACSGVSALQFAKNRALYEQGVRGETEHNAASFVGPWLLLPTDRSNFELLRDECEDVEESGDFPREGHMYMLLPLDGRLETDAIAQQVRVAYDLVCRKLTPIDRLLLAISDKSQSEDKLLDDLILHFDLAHHQAMINDVSRTALTIETMRVAEKSLPLGKSKIGGSPDLPHSTDWPTYRDGRPLSFLFQINCSEIEYNTRLNLPRTGVIAFFSVWGWTKKDDSSPQIPHAPEELINQNTWNRLFFFEDQCLLERRRAPRGTPKYKATSLKFSQHRSLPGTLEEMGRFDHGMNNIEIERYLELAYNYESALDAIRERRSRVSRSRHQLGGYGRFEADYPIGAPLDSMDFFFQLGSDPKADMEWGAAGDLYFYAHISEKCSEWPSWGACQTG